MAHGAMRTLMDNLDVLVLLILVQSVSPLQRQFTASPFLCRNGLALKCVMIVPSPANGVALCRMPHAGCTYRPLTPESDSALKG